jgi:hypothetical protein
MLTRNVAALVSKDDLPKAIRPRPKALTEAELRKLLQEAKSPTSRAKKRGYLSSQFAALVPSGRVLLGVHGRAARGSPRDALV